MDDEEGEKHPYLGATIMGVLAGKRWYYLCLLHSRYLCRKLRLPPSRLCFADKMAFALTPWWLYVPMAWLTSEIYEYQVAHGPETGNGGIENLWEWARRSQVYVRAWVEAHKDGAADTWTLDKSNRKDEEETDGSISEVP